jgi:outer membrane protein TolC
LFVRLFSSKVNGFYKRLKSISLSGIICAYSACACFQQKNRQPLERNSSMKTFLHTCFLFFAANSFAQSNTAPVSAADTFSFNDIFSLNLEEDIQQQLLPLDTIIQITFVNSPTLRFHRGEVESAEMAVILARRAWHSNIYGFASTSRGSQNLLLTSVNQGNATNSAAANGYSLGMTLTLPLSVFTQTPVRIRQMQAELDKFEARIDQAKMEVKKQIIAEYFNLISTQRLLKIQSEDVQTSTLSVNIAEVQFRNGNLPPQEFSRLKNLQTIARTNYEITFRNFATSYFQFEAMVGVEMFRLKNTLP